MVKNGEVCDDGNLGGCLSNCTGPTPGYSCTSGSLFTPSICSEKCGNMIITASENCEDGNTVNGDGCSSVCKTEVNWTCTTVTTPIAPYSLTTCKGICGNGLV